MLRSFLTLLTDRRSAASPAPRPMCLSDVWKPRSFRELRSDQSGAMMLIGIFMAMLLVSSIYYVMGIGEAVLFRERMQAAADAGAFGAAVMHAKGMNFIALINMIGAALLSILVALKLVALLCIVGMVLCYAIFIASWGTASAILALVPPLQSLQQIIDNLYDQLKDPIMQVLEVSDQIQEITAKAIPLLSQVRVIQITASAYGDPVQFAFTYPLFEPLPVDDSAFREYCRQAGMTAGRLIMVPFNPFLPAKVKNGIQKGLGNMSETFSQFFCGDGGYVPPDYNDEGGERNNSRRKAPQQEITFRTGLPDNPSGDSAACMEQQQTGRPPAQSDPRATAANRQASQECDDSSNAMSDTDPNQARMCSQGGACDRYAEWAEAADSCANHHLNNDSPCTNQQRRGAPLEDLPGRRPDTQDTDVDPEEAYRYRRDHAMEACRPGRGSNARRVGNHQWAEQTFTREERWVWEEDPTNPRRGRWHYTLSDPEPDGDPERFPREAADSDKKAKKRDNFDPCGKKAGHRGWIPYGGSNTAPYVCTETVHFRGPRCPGEDDPIGTDSVGQPTNSCGRSLSTGGAAPSTPPGGTYSDWMVPRDDMDLDEQVHEIEFTAITEIYSCTTSNTQKITLDDQLGPAGESPDGEDNCEKCPKRVIPCAMLGDLHFQLRVFVIGRSKLLKARRWGTRLGTWGRSVTDTYSNIGDTIARFSFAQAEYFFWARTRKQAQQSAENTRQTRGDWMWSMGWVQRMRRTELTLETGEDCDSSGGGGGGGGGGSADSMASSVFSRGDGDGRNGSEQGDDSGPGGIDSFLNNDAASSLVIH